MYAQLATALTHRQSLQLLTAQVSLSWTKPDYDLVSRIFRPTIGITGRSTVPTQMPDGHAHKVESPRELFNLSCDIEKRKVEHHLQNSFASIFEENSNYQVASAENGFIGACIEAYFGHHHLIFRPDDVWLSILTQLSIFVNANASLLRDKFVAHEGSNSLRFTLMANQRAGMDARWDLLSLLKQ